MWSKSNSMVMVLAIISLTVLISGCASTGPVKIYNADRRSGILTTDEIWSGQIHVIGQVIVPEGITLTIEPGTVVKFKHYRGYKKAWSKKGSLKVDGGTLRAAGAPEKQIWFTSDADEPINGDWGAITLLNSEDSVFDYVIVEFGELGIAQFDSAASISNSIVRWNNMEGLYAERSRLLLKNNTLYGNAYHEIAMEQYNQDAQIINNIFKDGHFGIHFERSSGLVEGNYFKNYTDLAITAGMASDITVIRNKFENIGSDDPISIYDKSAGKVEDNDFGDGSVPIPQFDYEDIRKYELGYIPSDPGDKYLYIYDQVYETRRTIKKIGKDLAFGWALVYTQDYLWRFSLGGGQVGESLDFIKIDPVTGCYRRYGNNEIMNPRGLAYDGEYFWVNDFSLIKLWKFKLAGDFIEIVDSFDIPEKHEGGTSGLTSDGQFLYLISRSGAKLYKLDKNANVVDEIYFEGRGIGKPNVSAGIVWTGQYFWTNRGSSRGLAKWTKDGKLVGGIYPPARGTWAVAWDGSYLWTIQRTCELWDDPKIYQIEILDDSLK